MATALRCHLLPALLLGLGAVWLWQGSVFQSLSFASPGHSELSQSVVDAPPILATPRANRNIFDLQLVAASDLTKTLNHDSGISASSSLWLSVVGISLAGVALKFQRRECGVQVGWRARGIRRFKYKFGGKGPPTTPKWLEEPRMPKDRSAGGLVVPAWLTLAKWKTWTAGDRSRSIRWWKQTNDEKGQPILQKGKEYTVQQAVDMLLGMNQRAPLKFDATIEVAMHMNLDPKYPDQQIRTSISLPHGTGKNVRVAVFCPMDDEDEVMAAGAFKCGQKLLEEIQAEKIDFDVLLAKPQMMPKLAKLGKILGPKRLMPSPKSGTVIKDYAQAIKAFQGGTVELRNDRNSLVHSCAGKISFGKEKLVENLRAVLNGIVDKRPDGAKKEYFKSVYFGATMSPSIKIAASEFPRVVEKTVATTL